MNLNLNADLKTAMKEKDRNRLTWIRQLKTDADEVRRIDGRTEISDNDIYIAANRFNKKLEASKEFNMDISDEQEFIQKYLKPVLSYEETKNIILEYILINEPVNIGMVMGYLNKNHQNELDMSLAFTIVKGELS